MKGLPALDALDQARHQAEMLGNLLRALELIDEALERADVESRHHLRRYRAWLLPQLSPRHDAAAPLQPDAGGGQPAPPELAVSDAQAEPHEGAVLALLLDLDHSGEGFVARLRLQQATGLAPGPLCPDGEYGADFATAVEQAGLALMRGLVRRRRFVPGAALLAHRRFVLQGPAAARLWVKDGSSIGAAAAVVLHSCWTDTPVPADLAITGGLDADGRVLPVGGLVAKVRAALRERPWLRLLVPAAAGQQSGAESALLANPRVRRVATLEQLLEQVFGPQALQTRAPGAVDIEDTVRLGTELYEKRASYAAAAEVLGTALEAISRARRQGSPAAFRVDELVSLWRLGSARIHLGQTTEAMACLQRARRLGRRLWEAGELDPRSYLGLRGNLAVLLRDVYRHDEAEALLRDNLQLQRQLRQDKREQAKTLGNLGELLTFQGRLDEAASALQQALELIRAVYPDELPRELCYLGNLQLRRGEPQEARQLYRQGLEANRRVAHGRQVNESFLRHGLVRALAAMARPREALREAEQAVRSLAPGRPYPRQLILKQRGLALLALGQLEAGRAGLRQAAELTFVRGALLRFGVGTALGELARHLLQNPAGDADRPQALAAAAELARRAAAVPGLDYQRSGVAEIQRLTVADQPRTVELEAALERLCAHFYYG